VKEVRHISSLLPGADKCVSANIERDKKEEPRNKSDRGFNHDITLLCVLGLFVHGLVSAIVFC
jgi:hypothetical protein